MSDVTIPVRTVGWLPVSNDLLQDAIVDAYEELVKDLVGPPRLGPKRRRVFVKALKTIPDEARPWRDQVIKLTETADDWDWDDLPAELRDAIGYWDWEYR